MKRSVANTRRRPCAACKHRKKKCTDDCLLAQYFPLERSEDYQSMNRLFKRKYVIKILESVPHHLREMTAEKLVTEAKTRNTVPSEGPLAFGTMLARQIVAEDKAMQEQLALDKEAELLQKKKPQQVNKLFGSPFPWPSEAEELGVRSGLNSCNVGSSKEPKEVGDGSTLSSSGAGSSKMKVVIVDDDSP